MQNAAISIRPADDRDATDIWRILEPVIREGSTYTLPSDMSEQDGLRYWRAPTNEVFVAEADGAVVGTYFMRPNQSGGGSHVANCGYMTAPWAVGRGVARAMCAHSLDHAKARGYRSMQFNFVVSTKSVRSGSGRISALRSSDACRRRSAIRASDTSMPS